MDDLASKIFAGIIGGLISSIVAWIANVKTRQQQIRLTERKELDDFLTEAAEYTEDATKLGDITQEIHGSGSLTRDDLENLFKLHSVDYMPATPKFLQKASGRVPDHVNMKLKQSKGRRSSLALAYKELLLNPQKGFDEDDRLTFQSMVEEVHRSTVVAAQAMSEQIDKLSDQLAELRRD